MLAAGFFLAPRLQTEKLRVARLASGTNQPGVRPMPAPPGSAAADPRTRLQALSTNNPAFAAQQAVQLSRSNQFLEAIASFEMFPELLDDPNVLERVAEVLQDPRGGLRFAMLEHLQRAKSPAANDLLRNRLVANGLRDREAARIRLVLLKTSPEPGERSQQLAALEQMILDPRREAEVCADVFRRLAQLPTESDRVTGLAQRIVRTDGEETSVGLNARRHLESVERTRALSKSPR